MTQHTDVLIQAAVLGLNIYIPDVSQGTINAQGSILTNVFGVLPNGIEAGRRHVGVDQTIGGEHNVVRILQGIHKYHPCIVGAIPSGQIVFDGEFSVGVVMKGNDTCRGGGDQFQQCPAKGLDGRNEVVGLQAPVYFLQVLLDTGIGEDPVWIHHSFSFLVGEVQVALAPV